MTTSESTPSQRGPYGLLFLPQAWDEWRALDGSIRKALKSLLIKRLVHPHAPGSALKDELAGLYKIKLLRHGIRLTYRVDDGVLVVIVFCVGKREGALAYRITLVRLKQAKAAGNGLALKSASA
ncbi:hypothetical protein CDN99_20755 [Roseateles aquatilis]|uniref:Addiction module toxin RelE n=1 Tax=Roseateles aquatilis TaxID=431061 RepID=A0A246J0Y8_9BURK|nr:type II toxin-antitoxin system RelE/ParE family toxin [Roseateles aquatilis]OWQ86267.1 hypothetical protein CDN99_20755 [Roseateles aquatilis]